MWYEGQRGETVRQSGYQHIRDELAVAYSEEVHSVTTAFTRLTTDGTEQNIAVAVYRTGARFLAKESVHCPRWGQIPCHKGSSPARTCHVCHVTAEFTRFEFQLERQVQRPMYLVMKGYIYSVCRQGGLDAVKITALVISPVQCWRQVRLGLM